MADTPTPILAAEVMAKFSYDPDTGLFLRKSTNTIAGYIDRKGHRRVELRGRAYRVARLIWLIQTGKWPTTNVDHKDTYGPKADWGDRWNNLRLATTAQNGQNRKRQRNNASGIPGVNWHAGIGRWVSSIQVNRRRIALGSYLSMSDATAARRAAEVAYFGDFAPTHEGMRP